MIKSGIKSPLDLNNTIHCYTTKIWSYRNKIEKFSLKKQKYDNFTATQSSNFVNFYQKITRIYNCSFLNSQLGTVLFKQIIWIRNSILYKNW